MSYNWKPGTFQAAVQYVASAQGEFLKAARLTIARVGSLTCPAPSWDQDGIYRVGERDEKLEIQRLDEEKGWTAAPLFSPRKEEKREKGQKFGILDAPTLLESDMRKEIARKSEFAVVYLDIDNFKTFNTRYTERIVDQHILPAFQTMINNCTEEHGYSYAEGGDEVTVLFYNVSEFTGVAFAEELRRTIESQEYIVNGKVEKLTVSVGIAHSANFENKENATDRANVAKKYAKESGKNCVFLAKEKEYLRVRILMDLAKK